MTEGFDSIKVHRVDTNKYRIVISGAGLTIDAMLIGVGADAIAAALDSGGNPAALLKQYKDKQQQQQAIASLRGAVSR